MSKIDISIFFVLLAAFVMVAVSVLSRRSK
jgi:hypothetical protein